MKIAMVITSLEVGGAEKLVLNLVRELKSKVEIRLLSSERIIKPYMTENWRKWIFGIVI